MLYDELFEAWSIDELDVYAVDARILLFDYYKILVIRKWNNFGCECRLVNRS
jgi:hypothetical protein